MAQNMFWPYMAVSQPSSIRWPLKNNSAVHFEVLNFLLQVQLIPSRGSLVTMAEKILQTDRVMAQNRFRPYMAVSRPSWIRWPWQKLTQLFILRYQCTNFEVNISIQYRVMAQNRFRPYMVVSRPSWIRRPWPKVIDFYFEVPTHKIWSEYLNPVPSYGPK